MFEAFVSFFPLMICVQFVIIALLAAWIATFERRIDSTETSIKVIKAVIPASKKRGK